MMMMIVGHVAPMEEWKGVCRGMVGKHEGKGRLGRPSHRWGDNLKWIFKKWFGKTWTGLILLRIRTGGGRL